MHWNECFCTPVIFSFIFVTAFMASLLNSYIQSIWCKTKIQQRLLWEIYSLDVSFKSQLCSVCVPFTILIMDYQSSVPQMLDTSVYRCKLYKEIQFIPWFITAMSIKKTSVPLLPHYFLYRRSKLVPHSDQYRLIPSDILSRRKQCHRL